MTQPPAAGIIQPQRLEQIEQLLRGTDFEGAALQPLAGDASFRRYIRLNRDGRRAMLMDAPVDKEDVRPYIAMAEYLCARGFSAPRIYARHVPQGLLLLEDLGDDSFTLLLKQSAAAAALEQTLYGAAIDLLADWHHAAFAVSSPAQLPLPAYDTPLLMREVSLFPDWFLPQAAGPEEALRLKTEFMQIWERILAAASLSCRVLVHRDYHADNLMWLPERRGSARVGLLDFQDGVYGDAAYDVVSLLEDARRDVPQPLADAMIARYIAASGVDPQQFRAAYAVLGAQRNCKIIGIFSRLAARDGKLHYLHMLPRVWRHLEHDVTHPQLVELQHWLDRYVSEEARGVIAVRHSAADLARSA